MKMAPPPRKHLLQKPLVPCNQPLHSRLRPAPASSELLPAYASLPHHAPTPHHSDNFESVHGNSPSLKGTGFSPYIDPGKMGWGFSPWGMCFISKSCPQQLKKRGANDPPSKHSCNGRSLRSVHCNVSRPIHQRHRPRPPRPH